MFAIIEILIFTALLILFLTSGCRIDIAYDDRLSISVTFVFTRLTLIFNNEESSGTRLGIPFYRNLIGATLSTISHSDIAVEKFSPGLWGEGPAAAIIPSILFPILITVISSRAKSFRIEDKKTDSKIKATISLMIFWLFIFLGKILYYYIKYRKRGNVNARKSDERIS